MRALFLATLLATATGFARAPDGLADAFAARSLLGPDVWARVVRIQNAGNRGLEKRTCYPATTYALLFELSGILWFYCDADGTQSLSLRLGSLEADKADPGPLFKAISPRFGSWEWVDGPARTESGLGLHPPNDCFIECVAILRRRAAAAAEPFSSSLLFSYVDTPTGRLGHTVLIFQARDGMTAVDPDKPDRPVRIPAPAGADPRAIARFLRGGEVAVARKLPIDPFAISRAAVKWTALSPASVPEG
jgi:hypothetical protein